MPARTPVQITTRQIGEALSPFGISLCEDQMARIREYVLLLQKWNRIVGLTSVTDPLEIVGRHFAESIYASKLLPVENCRLADVGTGAGFPGLALKIACPSIRVTLIEANKKKCAFLSEVVTALGLTAVEIVAERFEQIRPETVLANIVTARAVGEFRQLLGWSAAALAPRGHVVLWLGADDSTRIACTDGWAWQPTARLPDSQRRYILVGQPLSGPQALK